VGKSKAVLVEDKKVGGGGPILNFYIYNMLKNSDNSLLSYLVTS